MKNKTFLYLNIFVFFIPLYLLLPTIYSGNKCNFTAEGNIVLPNREFKFICKEGIFDLYHYFPDGSIRHVSGLYLNNSNNAALIKFNEKLINYHLEDEFLKQDVLNRGVTIYPFKKYDDKIEFSLFNRNMIKKSYQIKNLIIHKQK